MVITVVPQSEVAWGSRREIPNPQIFSGYLWLYIQASLFFADVCFVIFGSVLFAYHFSDDIRPYLRIILGSCSGYILLGIGMIFASFRDRKSQIRTANIFIFHFLRIIACGVVVLILFMALYWGTIIKITSHNHAATALAISHLIRTFGITAMEIGIWTFDK